MYVFNLITLRTDVFIDFLARCLTKDPKKRLSADQLLKVFYVFLTHQNRKLISS